MSFFWKKKHGFKYGKNPKVMEHFFLRISWGFSHVFFVFVVPNWTEFPKKLQKRQQDDSDLSSEVW